MRAQTERDATLLAEVRAIVADWRLGAAASHSAMVSLATLMMNTTTPPVGSQKKRPPPQFVWTRVSPNLPPPRSPERGVYPPLNMPVLVYDEDAQEWAEATLQLTHGDGDTTLCWLCQDGQEFTNVTHWGYAVFQEAT